MKVSILFVAFLALFIVSEAVDSGVADYIPDDSTFSGVDSDEAFLQVEETAEAKEAVQETAKAKVGLSMEVKQRLDMEMNALVGKMAPKHEELAEFVGVKSFAALADKAPAEGYGEMGGIMRAVDELESKLKDEKTKDLRYIQSVRTDCDVTRNKYINEIARAAGSIKNHADNVTLKRALIIDRNNKISATRTVEARLSSQLSTVKANFSEEEAGYWTRRKKRSHERVILTKALKLVCTFREFKDKHEYCLRIAANPDKDVEQGCQLKFSEACQKQKAILGDSVKSMMDTDKGLPYKSEWECVKRAKYYHIWCGFATSVSVTATYLPTSTSFEYPKESYDGWQEKREKAKETENDDLRITQERKTEVKKEVEKEEKAAEDAREAIIKKAEKDAEAGVKEYFNRLSENASQFVVALEEKDQVALEQKSIDEMDRLSMQSNAGPVRAIVKSVVVLARQKMLAAKKSLVDLMIDLRDRMRSEQAKEDADWEAASKEYQGQIKSLETQISEQINLRNTYLGEINNYNASIDESNRISDQEREVIVAQKALIATKTTYCRNEEAAYRERLTTITIELTNVEKLRSLLRELTKSELPKCPGDCIDRDHGRCVWKGRFGKDSYCACENEYYGSGCEKTKCPGKHGQLYTADSSDVCNNRGQCNTQNGKCTCRSRNVTIYGNSTTTQSLEYYHGHYNACEHARCPANYNFDPAQDRDQKRACLKRGTCEINSGVCQCNSTYYGTDCSRRKCPGPASGVLYAHNHPSACSGRGSCNTTNGTCSCDPKYMGHNCSMYKCPNNCSGRGSCNTSNGSCSCNSGYFGSDCSMRACPSNCHGSYYGTCNYSTGTCSCSNGVGSDCRRATLGYYHRAHYVWWTFDSSGWSECHSSFMMGIRRNSCPYIYCIEEFLCARPVEYSDTSESYSKGTTYFVPSLGSCHHPNFNWSTGYYQYWTTNFHWWGIYNRSYWRGSLDRVCPGNTFMTGLERNGYISPNWSNNFLNNMTRFKCCSISGGYRWKNCHWRSWTSELGDHFGSGHYYSPSLNWAIVSNAPSVCNGCHYHHYQGSYPHSVGSVQGDYMMAGLRRGRRVDAGHVNDIQAVYQCQYTR